MVATQLPWIESYYHQQQLTAGPDTPMRKHSFSSLQRSPPLTPRHAMSVHLGHRVAYT
jgi:hypothetical protein